MYGNGQTLTATAVSHLEWSLFALTRDPWFDIQRLVVHHAKSSHEETLDIQFNLV
jgi:hypothetical protein